ncbi:hypothetical protein Vafri_16252 [Volvox africanus]|uniref:Uncharacterized protein n=1 Tax=Volvox africanus TaxID=51714 RepID=A0A8J4BMU4_9CHLO|nr:hypothetical protein Vafri_16252 [Volvox africanus]
MADTSQLLAFRPRCRPPAPSAVNSWAVVNINVHLEQTAHQAAVVNFTHLRNALIDARHVLGEPEVVDGDGSGLFPAGAGRGDHAWRMPQPTPGPSPVVGMPAPESAHLPSMQKRLPAGPHHGRAAQTTTPPNLGGLNSRNQLEGQLNMSPSGTHVGTHSALKQLLVAETKQLERPSNTPSVMPASEVRRPSHQQHFEQRAQPPASRPAAAPPITRRRGLGLQAAPSSEWDLEFDQDLLEGLDGEMEMNPDGERTRPSHDPNSSTGQVARETADPSRRQEGHHQQQQRDYQQQWPLHKSVTVAAGSAGRQPADVGRRNSGELKQAVLVPGGRCALPPPPQLGEAWKAARPGGRVIAASTIAVEQQHQQRCVRSSASLQGQAQGTQAALGATARGKRPRGDEHGDEAAPLPPRGGGVDGKCAKKKAGGKDADGEAAEALLLPQLQLLCEALEGPEVGSGAAAVREVSELGVASELRGDISRSHLLLAGLLVAVSEGPVYQFASNMQSVSKPQREMLLKARRLLAKHPAASAAFNVREEAPGAAATAGEHGGSSSLHTDVEGSRSESRSRLGSGVQASEHLERCVGFCVMCLDERMCKELLGDSRGCSAITIGGGTIEAVGSAAGGDATGGGGGGGPGCVKMYLLPTALWPPPEARPAPWSGLGGRASAGSSGPQSLPPTAGPRLSHPTLLSLLDDVLVRAPCPVLCCNAKALLREAMSQGWRSPPPQQLRLIDPCVLAWMEAPQLAQRDEKEIEGYSIDTLCPRYGISLQPPQNRNAASCSAVTGLPSPPLAEGPLARLRRSLLATAKLFEAVRVRVQPWLRPQAVQVEMQVMAVLARMEALGIAVDAADLSRKAAAVRRRMEALSATASALLGGRPLNLGSSVQLAGVLYEELKLPPPVPQGQRDAATGACGGEWAGSCLKTQSLVDQKRCTMNEALRCICLHPASR